MLWLYFCCVENQSKMSLWSVATLAAPLFLTQLQNEKQLDYHYLKKEL